MENFRAHIKAGDLVVVHQHEQLPWVGRVKRAFSDGKFLVSETRHRLRGVAVFITAAVREGIIEHDDLKHAYMSFAGAFRDGAEWRDALIKVPCRYCGYLRQRQHLARHVRESGFCRDVRYHVKLTERGWRAVPRRNLDLLMRLQIPFEEAKTSYRDAWGADTGVAGVGHRVRLYCPNWAAEILLDGIMREYVTFAGVKQALFLSRQAVKKLLAKRRKEVMP